MLQTLSFKVDPNTRDALVETTISCEATESKPDGLVSVDSKHRTTCRKTAGPHVL